jgi:hypothetical protein
MRRKKGERRKEREKEEKGDDCVQEPKDVN